MSTVNENLQLLFSKMEEFVSTKVVVGEAVNYGNVIIVPLVEVSFGVCTGLSEAKTTDKNTGGGGLGARITPTAMVVIIDNTVQLVNVKNQESVNKLIDMIPGILSKFNLDSFFTKQDDKEVEEAAESAAV
jgi:uncharacterized spore protein YtfJ